MENRPSKPSRDELIGLLPTPGWHLDADGKVIKNRTLEEQVRAAHARYRKGETPGIIKRLEAVLELDLIQLQELWAHLGLPM